MKKKKGRKELDAVADVEFLPCGAHANPFRNIKGMTVMTTWGSFGAIGRNNRLVI
jgi:hypothetical protein